jgi:hypothetical protein
MSKTKLTESQFSALVKITKNTLAELKFERPQYRTNEITFTKEFVVPQIEKMLVDIKEKRLNLRGDGIQPVRPLFKSRFSIKPDIEIEIFGERLIAFEVKILRKNDPTGSLTKAIGQGLLYRAWGYKAAFVLIIDSNKNQKAMVPKLKNKIPDLIDNLFVYIY